MNRAGTLLKMRKLKVFFNYPTRLLDKKLWVWDNTAVVCSMYVDAVATLRDFMYLEKLNVLSALLIRALRTIIWHSLSLLEVINIYNSLSLDFLRGGFGSVWLSLQRSFKPDRSRVISEWTLRLIYHAP